MARYASEQTTYVFYAGEIWKLERIKDVTILSDYDELFVNMDDVILGYELVDKFATHIIINSDEKHCEFTVNGKGKNKTISKETYDFVKNSLNVDEKRQFNEELYDLGIKIC